MLCYFFTQSNEQTPRHALWVTQQRHTHRTRGHGTRDGMQRGTHSTKWCELTGASNSMPLHPNHYFVWRNKKIPPVLTNGQASVPPGNVLAVSSVNKGHGLFLLLGGFQLPRVSPQAAGLLSILLNPQFLGILVHLGGRSQDTNPSPPASGRLKNITFTKKCIYGHQVFKCQLMSLKLSLKRWDSGLLINIVPLFNSKTAHSQWRQNYRSKNESIS